MNFKITGKKLNWKNPHSVLGWLPKEYHTPEFDRYFSGFTKHVSDLIGFTGAGLYNPQFCVPEIKSRLKLGLDELENQHITHKHACENIKNKQDAACGYIDAKNGRLVEKRDALKKELDALTEKGVRLPERLHFLSHPLIQTLFVCFCIAADAYTQYSVFELMLTQAVVLTIVITGTVSLIINIIPVLGAALTRNKNIIGMAKRILAGLLLGVFILLFACCFSLRYSSRELLFEDTATLKIFDDDESEAEEEDPTVAENILAIILGLEPLATSVCCFFISYENDPDPLKRQHLEKEISKLNSRIDVNTVQSEEIRKDMTYDIQLHDTLLLKNARERIIDSCVYMTVISLELLSSTASSPEAVSYLLEGGFLEEDEVNCVYEKLSHGYYKTADIKLALSVV